MGSPPQRPVGKWVGQAEGRRRLGADGRGLSMRWVGAVYALGLGLGFGLLCVLVEPLLP